MSTRIHALHGVHTRHVRPPAAWRIVRALVPRPLAAGGCLRPVIRVSSHGPWPEVSHRLAPRIHGTVSRAQDAVRGSLRIRAICLPSQAVQRCAPCGQQPIEGFRLLQFQHQRAILPLRQLDAGGGALAGGFGSDAVSAVECPEACHAVRAGCSRPARPPLPQHQVFPRLLPRTCNLETET